MSDLAVPGHVCRVLVADDDAVSRKVAVAVLARLGHATRTATDGASALRAALTGDVALVLMDCRMPGLDGREATRRLRAAEAAGGRSRLPVLAMTADVDACDRASCVAAGMDDVITKPIDRGGIAAALVRWLGGDPSAMPAPRPGLAERPPVRLERLATIVGRERVTLRNYLLLFISIADRLVADLSGALRDGSAPEARRVAHQLRGSALSIGADALADAAAHVERLCSGPDAPAASAGASDVERAYASVRSYILAV